MKGSLGFLEYGRSINSLVSLNQVFRLTFKTNLNPSSGEAGGKRGREVRGLYYQPGAELVTRSSGHRQNTELTGLCPEEKIPVAFKVVSRIS